MKIFKKILIKMLKNLTKIWKFSYYRFSLLAEALTVPHVLQIFRVSGVGNVPSVPPRAATGVWEQTYHTVFSRTFFQVIPVYNLKN